MKAVVLKEPGKLEMTEIPSPDCSPGGVVIRITACGICSSDVRMVKNGHPALVYPRIPGHEMVGIVADSQADGFHPGDRVQAAPGLRCGQCDYCRKGSDNQCIRREIFGFSRDGGFAEYLSVPLSGDITGSVNHLPSALSDAAAVLAEPLACCINAQNKLRLLPGDAVLIIGAGPLGLLHAVCAYNNGIEHIFLSETDAGRRCFAAEMMNHAVQVIDPSDAGGLSGQITGATGGKGVDGVILACSQAPPDNAMLTLLKPGGKLSVFSGMPPSVSGSPVDMKLIHYKELTITGAYGCTAQNNRDAVDMLSKTSFPIQNIITGRVLLKNICEALGSELSENSFKIIAEVSHG